jgi:glutamate synthase (ferredoxin)
MMLKALDAGLAKVMSKMGISVVDSYRGAHLFDILGLHASVVERCFPNTPAPLSGIGFAELDRRLRLAWQGESGELPDFGLGPVPQLGVCRAAQVAAGQCEGSADGGGQHQGGRASEDPAAAFQIFSRNLDAGEAVTLRDLLEIRPAGPELALPMWRRRRACASGLWRAR